MIKFGFCFQAIKEGCQDELSVLNTRISEHCVQITDLVCQHTNELMSQWAHTGEHAKASETALIDQLHRVQIFLHEDLHADLPTGINIFKTGMISSVIIFSVVLNLCK